MTPPYRILCFDGGGVRGVLMLSLLLILDERNPGWRSSIDLYAGTSTGGLIALGLAAGWRPDGLLDRFRDLAPGVFADHWSDDVLDVGCALGAQYDSAGLASAASEILGDRRLGELPHRVLVPTFRLGRSPRAKFFHNFQGDDSDGAARAADVARYTSAAPIYFPTVNGFIDGGVVANHPGMAAIAQTQDARSRPFDRPALHSLRLLSVGGGADRRVLPDGDRDWGWLQWARALPGVFVDGGVSVVDYQCRQLLGERYHRIEPAFSDRPGPALDDVAAMPALEQLAASGMASQIMACETWMRSTWASTESD